MLPVIFLLMLTCWFAAIGVTAFGTLRALTYFRRNAEAPKLKPLSMPPVTILKPLKGNDPGLAGNLESFFNLDYGKYEILFSVADQNDCVIPLVRSLMAKYPNVDTRFFVGAENFGFNPKINKQGLAGAAIRGCKKGELIRAPISSSACIGAAP